MVFRHKLTLMGLTAWSVSDNTKISLHKTHPCPCLRETEQNYSIGTPYLNNKAILDFILSPMNKPFFKQFQQLEFGKPILSSFPL